MCLTELLVVAGLILLVGLAVFTYRLKKLLERLDREFDEVMERVR
jgi:uncharacterized membrane protein